MYIIKPETVAADMNVVIYGQQGVGKTVFAASAQDHPKMGDVLFANVEGGLISIASRGDIRAVDIRSVEHPEDGRPEHWEDTDFSLEELFWALANKDKRFKGIRTLVIDSVTELQTLNLEEIVRAANKKKKRPTRDDIYQEDYGKSTTQLKRLFRWYRDLPINVIWTALPKYVYPPGAGEGREPIAIMPSLTTKLGDSLMGYVDFVWYMYQTEDEDEDGNPIVNRHILTQPRGVYKAKTRGMRFSEEIGDRVTNPTLPELYDTFLRTEENK